MEATSINPTDIAVIVILLLSALLAFARGLVREVLSVGAWVGAAFAMLYLFPHVLPIVQQVVAKDGAWLPAPYLVDTLNIAPGERYDVLVDCQNPGAWAFHCHILPHAESDHGMFGMVTALVVQKA